MEISFTIKNADEIIRFLKERPYRTKEEINKAIKKSILQIERLVKQRAPVLTGRLRSSVQHKTYETALEGEVGVGVRYAIYFEAPYYKKARKTGESEFFSRSIEESESHINKFFEQAIENIIIK